eukprot:3224959-Heterocapsa_arctica.AAC.1
MASSPNCPRRRAPCSEPGARPCHEPAGSAGQICARAQRPNRGPSGLNRNGNGMTIIIYIPPWDQRQTSPRDPCK